MRRTSSIRILFAICSAAAGSLFGKPCGDARALLLKDVDSIRAPGGAPGAVLALGGRSFPLVMGRCPVARALAPVASGCFMGKGRVLAFGHENFFSGESFRERGMATLLGNAVDWLGRGAGSPVLAVHPSFHHPETLALLPRVRIRKIKTVRELAGLPAGSILAAVPDGMGPEAVEPLRAFIEQGGGLLTSGVGWGWRMITRKSLAEDNLFNRLLGPAGLYLDGNLPEPDGSGCYAAKTDAPGGSRLDDALRIAEKGEETDSQTENQVALSLLSALSALPPGSGALKRIRALADPALVKDVPAPGRPLECGRHFRERIALTLFQDGWLRDPAKTWPAHPAAASYPGLPPAGSPRITRPVEVDLGVPRWHSTGLFAAAGEPLTVTLPGGLEKAGLKVRIGSTSCRVTNHLRWWRAPVVDIEVPLTRRSLTLSSPFGGMVYLVVPGGMSGKAAVSVGPACPAPWYRSGRDTPAEWREKIRSLPAPMAEIESGKIVFTVPSEVARGCDDPEPLLKLWERVLDLDAKLTGLPPEREYAERFSADVHLCAGYMHAGYPIMVPFSVTRDLTDAATILAGKKDNVWGFFHEMGHNHQNEDWTFDGTGEVTVNFFTLYCMEHICGLKPRQTKVGQPWLRRKVRQWEARGRKYAEWKADPFLALEFFIRLQEKYGWEAFEKLFAEYRALPPGERPKNDLEKRVQWARRLSRITGEDQTPYFKSWNILP